MTRLAKPTDNALALAYAAGFIDGEGSFITTRKRSASGEMLVRPAVSVSQCDREPLDFLFETFGVGSITQKPERGTRRQIWEWRVQGENALIVAAALAPYLIHKRRQAALFLAFPAGRQGRMVSPEQIEARGEWASRLKGMNRVGVGS